ncbi:MAG: hypothetical protein JJU18_09760 [Oceanicaulis sp.]|nr:hypothetical protein [Oceanicaulis sp.]
MKDLMTIERVARSWPRVSLIDVTLRDGGFRTGFDWTEDEIVCVSHAALQAGCAYAELGYLGGVPELHHADVRGVSADLTPDVIARVSARVRPSPSQGALCAMIHPAPARAPQPFPALRQAGLDMVRLVYHDSWADSFDRMADQAGSAGLKVSGNLALTSRYRPEALAAAARRIAPRVDILYFADTCGALLPGEIQSLTETACGLCEIGFHGHDYLSMALSNSLAAAQAGARWIDASVHGIGRGAGNLRLELWLALAQAHSPAGGASLARLLPALDAIARRLGPPMAPDLVSLVSGALNLTPPQEDDLRSLAPGGDGAALRALAARLLELGAEGATISSALHDCAEPALRGAET